MGITIVNQYDRVVVRRWGSFRGVLDPGFHWLWPIMEQGDRVDIREQVDRVPTQKYITSDNVVVDMDFVIYYRVLADHAKEAVLDVLNYRAAVINLAFSTLRSVIGSTTLAQALSERERIQDQLQLRMDGVTGRWGVKVSQVEINEIDPPPGVKSAMEREKSAAAIKTADITESEGKRQAAINLAEGDKQSAILRAEGDRQAEILNAQGFSIALERINDVAKSADTRTMSLQYFETLKDLGASAATKFVLPMELTTMLQSFIGSLPKGSGSGNDQRERG